MRSVEEKTPSVAGLLSPDGSPRIDISKSLRKKRDPTAIRQGLLKTSLDVRLDYAPIVRFPLVYSFKLLVGCVSHRLNRFIKKSNRKY